MTALRPQPLLMDTSAESRIPQMIRTADGETLRRLLRERPMAVSAITVLERIRGFTLARERAEPGRRQMLDEARIAYLSVPRKVLPMDGGVSLIAGEMMALLPAPPSPPKRSHRGQENRGERLARWRFDLMIAATALAFGYILVHENAADFDPVREAVGANAHRFPGLNGLVTCRLNDIAALLG